jgi:predicted dehydrogenase
MSKPARLGVVGPGIIWQKAHKPCLQKLKDRYEIAAFCSRTKETRKREASEFPGAQTFSDYRELVKSPGVDGVVVLTPIALNARVAVAALTAGKDVYLEKPMAASVEEADEVLAFEKSSGRTVYVLEQIPYSTAWAALKGVLASGEIGTPVMYDKVTHNLMDVSVDSDGYAATTWRIHTEFPLGCLFDGGIHAIALLATLFGPPRSVCAAGQSFRETYGDYDNINMLFEYESGFQGFFSFSGYLGGNRNYFHIRCTDGLIALEDRKFIVEPNDGEGWTNQPDEGQENNPHLDMWKSITESRHAGAPPLYTSEMGRRDVYTLLCVEKSIKTGRKVFL